MDTGELLDICRAGQNGNWLTCNFQKNRCYRYDDGTFLVRNENGAIEPVPFPKPEEDGILTTEEMPTQLITTDNAPTDFSFEIQNKGKGDMYWINAVPETDLSDPLIFYPPPKNRRSKTRRRHHALACKVSAHNPRTNPKPRDSYLRFHITSAHAAPIPFEIPVRIRVPEIQLLKAELQNQEDKRTLQVTLQNTGEQDLMPTPISRSKSETRFSKPKSTGTSPWPSMKPPRSLSTSPTT